MENIKITRSCNLTFPGIVEKSNRCTHSRYQEWCYAVQMNDCFNANPGFGITSGRKTIISIFCEAFSDVESAQNCCPLHCVLTLSLSYLLITCKSCSIFFATSLANCTSRGPLPQILVMLPELVQRFWQTRVRLRGTVNTVL